MDRSTAQSVAASRVARGGGTWHCLGGSLLFGITAVVTGTISMLYLVHVLANRLTSNTPVRSYCACTNGRRGVSYHTRYVPPNKCTA